MMQSYKNLLNFNHYSHILKYLLRIIFSVILIFYDSLSFSLFYNVYIIYTIVLKLMDYDDIPFDESPPHKNAKESLYRRILQDGSFSWVKKNDSNLITGTEQLSRHKDRHEAVLMEVPSSLGDLPSCICSRSICKYISGNSNYGDESGYFKCKSCVHKSNQYKYNIRHDIVAFSKKNRIRGRLKSLSLTNQHGREIHVYYILCSL